MHFRRVVLRIWHSTLYSIVLTMDISDRTAALSFLDASREELRLQDLAQASSARGNMAPPLPKSNWFRAPRATAPPGDSRHKTRCGGSPYRHWSVNRCRRAVPFFSNPCRPHVRRDAQYLAGPLSHLRLPAKTSRWASNRPAGEAFGRMTYSNPFLRVPLRKAGCVGSFASGLRSVSTMATGAAERGRAGLEIRGSGLRATNAASRRRRPPLRHKTAPSSRGRAIINEGAL